MLFLLEALLNIIPLISKNFNEIQNIFIPNILKSIRIRETEYT